MKQVVGIELCAPAVEDARHNASVNGIHNAVYFARKAEDVMAALLLPGRGSEGLEWSLPAGAPIVAVVDPPRAGLHPSVSK